MNTISSYHAETVEHITQTQRSGRRNAQLTEKIVRNTENTATLEGYITLRRGGKNKLWKPEINEQEGPKLVEKEVHSYIQWNNGTDRKP